MGGFSYWMKELSFETNLNPGYFLIIMVVNSLEGILNFFAETGTEGGYWAFQDSLYIEKDAPRGYCKNCGLFLQQQTDFAPVQVQSVIKFNAQDLEEYNRTGKLPEKRICANDSHIEERSEAWDYQGLHLLKNGDHLTIYNPTSRQEVWSGVIALKQYPPFTESVFGYWIHAGQIGVEREAWAEYFFEEFPAKLEKY